MPTDKHMVPQGRGTEIENTWYSIYQFTDCFTLQTSNNDVIYDFCVSFNVISDVIQNVQHHHDLIKAHAVR